MSTPQEQAEPVAGDAFDGRYEIVAPISSGAMGAVYRAIDREEGREVAVKRLLDVRHAARFEIEARLLATLSHPRLVKVLDHASDEQGAYIVMDLVHGVDLGAILKRNGQPGLTIGDAIEYARHGCEALQYVHDQQIVHRDVKPPNMILGDEGVILVDFGVARALGAEEDQGTIAVGTPRYMAPEVFAGGTVSAASDIFSLAATLWTMVIGAPPRYGDTLKLSLNTARQKTKNLFANPVVDLLILDVDNTQRYLEVRGDATIELDTDYVFADAFIQPKYGLDALIIDQPGEERTVVTINPVRIHAVDMDA